MAGRDRWLPIAMALLAFSNAFCSEEPAEGEEPFLLSFVVGNYALVGQYPDSTTPYSGKARIEKRGKELALIREIAGKKSTALGRIEVPHPPGEGEVLRFRWTEQEPQAMTCMVKGDLDNYARLTCLWGRASGPSRQPGIEALFPTEVWPDDAPSKGGVMGSTKKGDAS